MNRRDFLRRMAAATAASWAAGEPRVVLAEDKAEPPIQHPKPTVAAPHLGAWIAKVLGPRNPAIPAFIDVGQRLEDNGEKEELKAFHTAGFLGTEYGPFLLPYPDQAIESVRPPKGTTPGRFAERY